MKIYTITELTIEIIPVTTAWLIIGIRWLLEKNR